VFKYQLQQLLWSPYGGQEASVSSV